MNALLSPIVLTLISAVAFAAGDIVGRFAVRRAPAFMGGFMSAVVGLVVFGAIWLAAPSEVRLNAAGIGWFILAGVIHPAFGFIVLLEAFKRIGVARSAAIVGTSPFFSLLIAVIFLGERPGWLVAGATILLILGVVLISLEEGESGRFKPIDLFYPIFAAFLFGLVPALRKAGLNHIPSPVLGMAVSSLSGAVCLLACSGLFPSGEAFSSDRKGVWLYTISGFVFALAVYLYSVALKTGRVSILAPLLSTYPLIVLIIGYFVLRNLERLTFRLAVGVVLIVSGAALITGFG